MRRLFFIFAELLFAASVFSQSWSLTGNAGTTNSNFVGTSDDRPLIFRVNNQSTAGFTGYGGNYNVSFGFRSFNPFNAGWDNTAFGAQTLTYNTTGIRNVAIGTYALDMNYSGQDNVAVGESASGRQNGAVSFTVSVGRAALMNNQTSGNTAIGFEAGASNSTGEALTATGFKALRNNSTGGNNTANGFNALINNSTGWNNTAVGAWSLVGNTTGNHNTTIGMKSLYSNTTGEYNTAIGVQALELNTAGIWNVGLGSGALNQNTTGSLNTAGGTSALWSNRTGSFNTAFGQEALAGSYDGNNNTAIGFHAMFSTDNSSGAGGRAFGHSSNNTAVGYEALRDVGTGNYNVGVGVHSLLSNNSGGGNVALGCYSLAYNTSGSNNIAIGSWALGKNTTGSYNTAIGDNAGVSSGNLTNATAIGYGAIATASNQVTIGNSDVTSIRVHVSLSTFSDSRMKKNVKANVPGLAFINKLQPVTYNMDLGANSPHANKLYTGLVAQDVEKAAKSIKYDFSGVDIDESGDRLYSLRYSVFIAPLVQAVQELSAQNEAKDSAIASLQQQINKLTEAVNRLSGNNTANKSIAVPDASLGQNYPNPFSQSTNIGYSLPQNVHSAKIVLTDASGKVFKQIPVSVTEDGVVKIEAESLPAGVYFYSLYMDNTLVDTKKMVLSK